MFIYVLEYAKEKEIIRIISHSNLAWISLVLELKISYPGKPLSPGQTGMTGYAKNKAPQIIF